MGSSLAIQQNGLTIRIEGAIFNCNSGAAPCPDGILIGHSVVKGTSGKGCYAVKRQLPGDSAVIECQIAANDSIKVAFTCFDRDILKSKLGTSLITKHATLSIYCILNYINRLCSIADNLDIPAIVIFIGSTTCQINGHTVFQRNGCRGFIISCRLNGFIKRFIFCSSDFCYTGFTLCQIRQSGGGQHDGQHEER